MSTLLGTLLLPQAGDGLSKQMWIADLKANRATLGTSEVRVRGDVVDIRSTSPAARFGFYRLIDASDPSGVLIRTNKLPTNGGTLRVRALVVERQPSDGSLLLDELARAPLDRRSGVALVLTAISALSLVTLGVLLVRAAAEERRYKTAPPLWLLSDAGPYGRSVAAPSTSGGARTAPLLKYSSELEEQDLRRRERLKKRTHNLLELTLGSLAVTGVSSAWLLISSPAAAQVPAFIFIAANDVPIPAAVAPVPGGDTSLTLSSLAPSDLAAALVQLLPRELVPPPGSPAWRRGDSVQLAPRSPAATKPPVQDSVVTTPPPTPTPAPTPLSAPSPLPAAPEPRPSVRDLALERSRAASALADGVRSLVQAINARRMSELSTLLPEALAEDAGERRRFLKLIDDFSPSATTGPIGETTLSQDRGEGKFTIPLTWRGDFGVSRRMAGQFLAVVRREGNGWRFDGARLLTAVGAAAAARPGPPPAGPRELPRDLEAMQALAAVARQLVDAVNARQLADLSRLLPESLAVDQGRRQRFFELVQEFGPQARLGGVEDVALAEDRGEGRFGISFSWRGNFGVVQRKAGQFVGVIRRQGGGAEWRFDGARLLNAVP